MKIRKLESTNAFLAIDLEGAPAAGFVRCAPKILQGGAKDFARSRTYTYASFEQQRSGLSGGISSPPDDAAAAIAAFAAELESEASSGSLAIEPAKGVAADAISTLAGPDAPGVDAAIGLTATGIAAAAKAAAGSLEDASVVLEGFAASGPAIAAELGSMGARIVAVGTPKGTATNDSGFSPDDLSAAWESDGLDMPATLAGGEAAPPAIALKTPCDVLFAGSKTGVISHNNALDVDAKVVVPINLLPFTARAIAMLQRSDTIVVPDFLALAGPVIGGDDIADRIGAAIGDSIGHAEGLMMGACVRAGAFLSSWQDQLPFGRPMAS